jgi:proteic killer suppression protein
MIKGFRSKKLKSFWLKGDESKIDPIHLERIDEILTWIESSHQPKDLKAVFGQEFSEKKGDAKGVFSIVVRENWRITFEIEHEGAVVVDYLDYHGKRIRKKGK